METSLRLGLLLFVPAVLSAAASVAPESWIPARWTGGPLEIAQRTKTKTLPADPSVRESIATWYEPATLNLLEGSPVNCLLVTWSAGADPALERQQQQLVKTYAAEAHKRGLSVLGLVYSGSDYSGTDATRLAASGVDARLDGLVLEGEFPAGFTAQVTRALVSANGSAVVIPTTAPARSSTAPIVAMEGVSPSARNLSDMGIRGAPSSEPWIESNVWLVRSLRLTSAWRPVWVGYQPEGGSPVDYAKAVADAAMAGGRWIVALDDTVRAKLRRHDTGALAVWQSIGDCLKFAEDHADWRSFQPYGNLGIIVDTHAADRQVADEFLKLVARRQMPYRLITRSGLSAGSLAGLRAVLATEIAPPTDGERQVLKAFAQNGGLIVTGPSWGDAPPSGTDANNPQPYAEVPLGKGRAAVYKDADPESIAREMRELMSHKDAGVVAFNVPSVIMYASTDGKRILVQLLNYSNTPATAITLRVAGTFKTARLIAPDAEPALLEISSSDGQTDITIPKVTLWGGVLLD